MRSFFAPVVVLLSSGCHHPGNIELTPSRQTYCWWASQYASLSPVWLAPRFQRALNDIGFTRTRWGHNADSAWAMAGPTTIKSVSQQSLYAFRAVAYAPSDSINCAWRGKAEADIPRRPSGAGSCFHTAVFIYMPSTGDSVATENGVLPLCGEIYRSALSDVELLK